MVFASKKNRHGRERGQQLAAYLSAGIHYRGRGGTTPKSTMRVSAKMESAAITAIVHRGRRVMSRAAWYTQASLREPRSQSEPAEDNFRFEISLCHGEMFPEECCRPRHRPEGRGLGGAPPGGLACFSHRVA